MGANLAPLPFSFQLRLGFRSVSDDVKGIVFDHSDLYSFQEYENSLDSNSTHLNSKMIKMIRRHDFTRGPK